MIIIILDKILKIYFNECSERKEREVKLFNKRNKTKSADLVVFNTFYEQTARFPSLQAIKLFLIYIEWVFLVEKFLGHEWFRLLFMYVRNVRSDPIKEHVPIEQFIYNWMSARIRWVPQQNLKKEKKKNKDENEKNFD